MMRGESTFTSLPPTHVSCVCARGGAQERAHLCAQARAHTPDMKNGENVFITFIVSALAPENTVHDRVVRFCSWHSISSIPSRFESYIYIYIYKCTYTIHVSTRVREQMCVTNTPWDRAYTRTRIHVHNHRVCTTERIKRIVMDRRCGGDGGTGRRSVYQRAASAVQARITWHDTCILLHVHRSVCTPGARHDSEEIHKYPT